MNGASKCLTKIRKRQKEIEKQEEAKLKEALKEPTTITRTIEFDKPFEEYQRVLVWVPVKKVSGHDFVNFALIYSEKFQ